MTTKEDVRGKGGSTLLEGASPSIRCDAIRFDVEEAKEVVQKQPNHDLRWASTEKGARSDDESASCSYRSENSAAEEL
eukprot:CAMPEP_0206432446 /NCGR_PEP_ID=MMETSP0324_2-20121206/7939_1 /ASSEMBLY_ACC=CAM_ASM_000836 /TAXON_ID=2866 /ORGANISM="Crypthecodinium cohnii, Strain Seligo" /LENGTH=77 /DNA_ID=CAMNT_0053898515 /DNA_START=31 /DNA_END=264 /DNA_ORIENTATION=-